MHDIIIVCIHNADNRSAPPANFGATSRRDNRVYLRRRVITFLEQFLRTFGGYSSALPNAKPAFLEPTSRSVL